MNVPRSSSSKASSSFACEFITIGPACAIGVPIGFPDTDPEKLPGPIVRRNRSSRVWDPKGALLVPTSVPTSPGRHGTERDVRAGRHVVDAELGRLLAQRVNSQAESRETFGAARAP